jgi:hypothetical protein
MYHNLLLLNEAEKLVILEIAAKNILKKKPVGHTGF